MRDKHHCIVTADRSLQQLLLYWTISRQKSFVCCLEIGQYLWDNFVGQQQTCYDVRCSDNKVGHVLRCEWSTCLLTIQRPTGSSGFRSSIRPSVRPLTLIACVTVLHWWVSVFGRISVKLGVSYELELLQEIKARSWWSEMHFSVRGVLIVRPCPSGGGIPNSCFIAIRWCQSAPNFLGAHRSHSPEGRSYLVFKYFQSRNTKLLVRAFTTYVRPLFVVNSQVWSPHLLRYSTIRGLTTSTY